METHVDVLVVGGGPAGCTAAAALARASVSVCLATLDHSPTCIPSETLNHAAALELARVGIPESSLIGAECYGIESSWGSETPAFHSFIMQPLGKSFHVDRCLLHEALLANARSAGSQVLRNARFVKAESAGTTWQVTLRNGGEAASVRCSFLIDATGRSSLVARSLGVRRRRFDALCGVSAVFESDWRGRTLLVGAAPYGWWYVAPVPPHCVMACLVSDVDVIRTIGALEPPVWSALASEISLIGSAASVSVARLRVHPCETSALEHFCGQTWLAAGDAASIFDPLSSAGVYKALASGREAAAAALGWLDDTASSVSEYGKRRRQEFDWYLRRRCSHYSVERRWLSHPFWLRRAASAQC